MNESNTTNINFTLPKPLSDEFKTLCRVNHVPVSLALRSLIQAAIDGAKAGRPATFPVFRLTAPEIINLDELPNHNTR